MFYLLIMLLVFGILVFIHEFGHFITARLCGVSVKEFAIGMGPTIFSWHSKKHGTKYGLRLLPIGGFVSMAFVPTVIFTLILTREQSREGAVLLAILCPIFLLMSTAFGIFGLILSAAALGISVILIERRSFLDRIGKM